MNLPIAIPISVNILDEPFFIITIFDDNGEEKARFDYTIDDTWLDRFKKAFDEKNIPIEKGQALVSLRRYYYNREVVATLNFNKKLSFQMLDSCIRRIFNFIKKSGAMS